MGWACGIDWRQSQQSHKPHLRGRGRRAFKNGEREKARGWVSGMLTARSKACAARPRRAECAGPSSGAHTTRKHEACAHSAGSTIHRPGGCAFESGGTHPALRPWSSLDALEEPRRGLVSSLETLLQLKVRTGSILTSFAQGYASGGSRLHARGRARHAITGGKTCCAYRAQRWRDRRHGGPESSPRAETDERS